MRRLALLALALLAACNAAPPAPTTTPAATSAAVAPSPTAAPAPTAAPVASATSAPLSPTATPMPVATALPNLPSALIDGATAGNLAALRAFGLGYPFALTFTPEGELAVGSSAGLAWLNPDDLSLKRFAPLGPVYDLVFSDDGVLLAHSVYDGSTESSVLRLVADGSVVAEVAGARPIFSPDGVSFATSDSDYAEANRTSLWDSADGTLLAELAGTGPRFNADGSYLATVERSYEGSGTVRIFADGLLLLELPGDTVAFSPDGASVAIAAPDAVTFYALPDGDVEASVPTAFPARPAFSAAGDLLLVADGATLIVWDLATNSERARLPDVIRGGELADFAEPLFSPDSAVIASFEPALGDCPPGGISLHEVATGDLIFGDSSSSGAAFSPDSTLAATLPGFGVRTVELRSGTATDRDLVGYGAMALSPSGATLAAATAFRDEESYLVGRIDLWEIESGELRASLHTDPEDFVFNLSDLRFSADGSRITALANYGCAAAGFNRLITWDVAGGTVVNDEVGLPVPFDESGMPLGSQPLALAFTGDGSQATWADSERGTLLYRQGAALISIGTETLDVAAAFSPDGGLLAVADETGAVRLLDPASGQVEGSWQLEAEPRELRFSDDGSMLLVLLFNDTLVALGVGEQQERARFSVASESAGLSVSADNELLALSSPEGAHLYALPSGTSLGTLEGSFDGALLGPGRRLLATVGDGRVLLWGAP